MPIPSLHSTPSALAFPSISSPTVYSIQYIHTLTPHLYSSKLLLWGTYILDTLRNMHVYSCVYTVLYGTSPIPVSHIRVLYPQYYGAQVHTGALVRIVQTILYNTVQYSTVHPRPANRSRTWPSRLTPAYPHQRRDDILAYNINQPSPHRLYGVLTLHIRADYAVDRILPVSMVPAGRPPGRGGRAVMQCSRLGGRRSVTTAIAMV